MRVNGRRASLAAPSGRAGSCWAHTECHVLPPANRPGAAQCRCSHQHSLVGVPAASGQTLAEQRLPACPSSGARTLGGRRTGRHFTRPSRGEVSQESRRLRSKSPARFHTHHDELAPASCRQFRVCIPPFSGGRSGDRVADDTVGAGTRPTIARYRRDHGGVYGGLRPLPKREAIGQHLGCDAGASMFMSRNRTLGATRAPASRHTQAAAHSRGAPRAPKTPAVGQAAR